MSQSRVDKLIFDLYVGVAKIQDEALDTLVVDCLRVASNALFRKQ